MSPLHQFIIHPLFTIKIGGIDLSFSNSSLAMVMATALIILICNVGTRKRLIVPNRLQSLAEVMFDFINNVILEVIGEEGRPYFPLILSIFLFIFFGNVLGLIPYNFTFTSHIIVTFALAVVLYTLVLSIGIYRFGLGFFKKFIPPGVPWPVVPIILPVEIISYFFRPVSLAIRLFANMLAGHVLLKIAAAFCVTMGVFGIFPIAFDAGFLAFEFFIAGLQAYIFTILSCVYIQDALHSH